MGHLQFTIRKRLPPLGVTPPFELDVTLDCAPGITVIFGASGAGKTLTLDSLAGFVRPDEGRILLDDSILFDAGSGVNLPPRKRGVGYVFQNYALFPHMTLEQNLAFGIHRVPPLERRRRIGEMLESFELTSLAARRPHELSGGQKQRASIARALLTQPRLLLLDEPVRGLDAPLRADFYEILRGVRARFRIPILLVTHDVAEGFFLGDQMAVYGAGRVVQLGTPEEVYRKPRTPAVARLLGISNIFSGVIEELDPMSDYSLVRTASFALRLPYLPGRLRGDTVSFCIPAEQVALVSRSDVARTAPASGESRSGPARANLIPVRVLGEVFAPTTVRLDLEICSESASALCPDRAVPAALAGDGSLSAHSGEGAADATPQGQSPRLECELSRAAYQRLKIAQQRDWLAELPASSIHLFTLQT